MSIPTNVNASGQYWASAFTVSSTVGQGAYNTIQNITLMCVLFQEFA